MDIRKLMNIKVGNRKLFKEEEDEININCPKCDSGSRFLVEIISSKKRRYSCQDCGAKYISLRS